jgi:hypothetical protein
VSPWTVRDRCTGEVDDGIDGSITQIFEPCDSTRLSATDFRDFFRPATPDSQAMTLSRPELAELTSYQTSTAGQQYVHDIFLAWRFTLITSLFL